MHRKEEEGGPSIAIYHCSIKIISRSKGKTAVAVPYRAGETLTNQFDGITHDYTRKGGVVHTEILLPGNSPAEYADRAILWNAVEKIEKAKNAQLAREIEIALPVKLTQEQNISLVREYVKRHFVAAGMCDYIQSILSHKAQTGKSSVSQALYNLKDAAKMLSFLTANNIMNMAGLDEHFSGMIDKQMDIWDKLKPIERRLPVLKKALGAIQHLLEVQR